MFTAPLELEDLIGADADAPAELASRGVDIGHVHLKVADVDAAAGFWTETMGMELMTKFGADAAFLGQDGYHHHVGANTWASRGAPLEPQDGAGPRRRRRLRRPGRRGGDDAGRDRDRGRAASAGRLSMSEPFRHRLRVRYSECDPQGHVFNARYLEYFDIGMTELWRETVGPVRGGDGRQRRRHGRRRGHDPLLRLAAVRPGVRPRDDRHPHGHDLDDHGDRGSSTSTATARAEGEIRHVFITKGTSSKTPIPDEVRTALAPFATA